MSTLECPICRYDKDEAHANARLIAAAPTLLDAAREALPILEEMGTRHREARLLRAAIAAAEGNQS